MEEVVVEEEMLPVSFSEKLGDGEGFRGTAKNRPDWEESEEGRLTGSVGVFLFWGPKGSTF